MPRVTDSTTHLRLHFLAQGVGPSILEGLKVFNLNAFRIDKAKHSLSTQEPLEALLAAQFLTLLVDNDCLRCHDEEKAEECNNVAISGFGQ